MPTAKLPRGHRWFVKDLLRGTYYDSHGKPCGVDRDLGRSMVSECPPSVTIAGNFLLAINELSLYARYLQSARFEICFL